MPIWLTLILALGGSTLISLIVSSIWHSMENRVKSKKEKAKEDKERLRELERERKEQLEKEEDLKRQLEWEQKIYNLIEPIDKKIDEIKAELAENKEATITSLRAHMKSLRDQYIAQGFADGADKATWRGLYKQYSDMGGNHFKEYVNGWRDDIEDLPMEKRKKTTTNVKKIS